MSLMPSSLAQAFAGIAPNKNRQRGPAPPPLRKIEVVAGVSSILGAGIVLASRQCITRRNRTCSKSMRRRHPTAFGLRRYTQIAVKTARPDRPAASMSMLVERPGGDADDDVFGGDGAKPAKAGGYIPGLGSVSRSIKEMSPAECARTQPYRRNSPYKTGRSDVTMQSLNLYLRKTHPGRSESPASHTS